MQILIPFKVGQRLGAAMGLVLLLTTLISGLSLALSQRLDADLMQVDEYKLPSVRLVHALGRLVDGQRGMAALHLLPQPSPEREALEARLQATRQTIQRQMASYEPRVAGTLDRQHFETVKASLVVFWAAQDRLLAASRLAAAEASAKHTAKPASPALAHARSLLTGESQQAFLQLEADLDAWWAFHEQATHLLAQQAHAAVQQALVMLAGLCAVAWLLGAVAWYLVRQASAERQAVPPDLPPPQQPTDGAAGGPHQAAARAIQTAREGMPAVAGKGHHAERSATQPPTQTPTQAANKPGL